MFMFFIGFGLGLFTMYVIAHFRSELGMFKKRVDKKISDSLKGE